MLVLDRKVGETFEIGNNITIMIVGTKSNGHVKIGIKAPKDIHVMRTELLVGERVRKAAKP